MRKGRGRRRASMGLRRRANGKKIISLNDYCSNIISFCPMYF